MRKVSPALPVFFLAFSTSSIAEETKKIEKIEVSSHYENAVGTADAASQGVVTSKLIENRPALRTGELLEFVPGVIVTQHSGDGKANQFFLRGFNLDHGTDFATFVDGMPVNMRSHAHGQGYSDLNFLIPELVQRIEYQKGPYYAEQGDFASAGAARLRLFNEMPRNIFSATLGQNGYERAVVGASTSFAQGTLLTALESARNDGPWKVPENFRKTSAVMRYTAGAQDNGYSVTGMAYQASWRSTDQIPLRAVQSGTLDRFGAVNPTDGGDTARYSLSFDLKRSTDNGLFQFNAYAVKSRLNLFSDFTFALDHPFDLGDPIRGDQFEQTERRRMLGFEASQTWQGAFAGMEMANKIGLQTRYDLLDPVAIYSTVAKQQVETVRFDRVKEASAGIYFENSLRWNDWLRTVAGVRLDQYRFDVASNIAANSGKVSERMTSPKLSAIFGPWAKTEFFLNYGEGFHSNDARGATAHITPKEGLPTDPVTPLVKTRGAEFGVRTEIVPGLQSSLALWQLKLASELVFSGDAGDTSPSRASRRHGVEWNNHYIAAPWLLFDLDLSLSRARYTQFDPVGNYIPGSIEKVASFGVSVNDLGPWFGAFQMRYFGPRALIEDNSQRSASTTLGYLRAGYKIDRNWKVALDVFNLFNRKASDIDYYYASRLPGEPADGVNDIHFHPVEPRSFRLTVTAHF